MAEQVADEEEKENARKRPMDGSEGEEGGSSCRVKTRKGRRWSWWMTIKSANKTMTTAAVMMIQEQHFGRMETIPY